MTWAAAFDRLSEAFSTALDTFRVRVEAASTNLRLRLVESEIYDLSRDVANFYKHCRAAHLRQCRELAAEERRAFLLQARLPELEPIEPRSRRRVCAGHERWRVMFA